MGDDVKDIGVPVTEPTADPGALENDGVLTVDVEAEVEAEVVVGTGNGRGTGQADGRDVDISILELWGSLRAWGRQRSRRG